MLDVGNVGHMVAWMYVIAPWDEAGGCQCMKPEYGHTRYKMPTLLSLSAALSLDLRNISNTQHVLSSLINTILFSKAFLCGGRNF